MKGGENLVEKQVKNYHLCGVKGIVCPYREGIKCWKKGSCVDRDKGKIWI